MNTTGPDSPLHTSEGEHRPRISALGGPDAASRDDIFFAAIQTTRMPMIITNPHLPDNPIVFANEAFLGMTGYSEDELLGRNCRFLQGPETSHETVRAVREAIAREREIACEILNYRRDGSAFWNALFISPVRDHEGRVIFFFASQLDVSRRRDAEAALHQAQKMEALGQLTGGIAHDFNNLLQVMQGHAGMALKNLSSANPDLSRVDHALERIVASVQRAAQLTAQLLAFARKQTLSDRVINLSTSLPGMLQLARGTLGERIVLKEELSPTLWNCRVDPTQMEVALLNLLINARDAMRGSGLITIVAENVDVDTAHAVRGLPSGRYVRCAVLDKGCGIPSDQLMHVMEPFFTTKGEGEGTGLGLAMVYGFAKQSNGSVQIESEVGSGTAVNLYFPAVDHPTSTSSARTQPGLTVGNERVMVVDDRPEVAEVAASMLEDLGYRTHVVHGPREALSCFESDKAFDLLLTDIVMPGEINGIELARRSRTLIPDLKVLLATGYAESVLEGRANGSKEFEVVLKPYSQAELGKRVRDVLDRASGAQR